MMEELRPSLARSILSKMDEKNEQELPLCHICGKAIQPQDIVFKYSDLDRASLPYHRMCMGKAL